jgi:hypothetical protein
VTETLDPNRQLRWALEHLPDPSTTSGPIEVTAPSLDSDELVRVPLARARRQHEGREVDGWLYEGLVSIEAGDLDVSSGYPGTEAFLRGALGPYCLSVEVLEDRGHTARVRIFGTTREQLDA